MSQEMSQGSIARQLDYCGWGCRGSGIKEVGIKTPKHLHLIDNIKHLDFISVIKFYIGILGWGVTLSNCDLNPV